MAEILHQQRLLLELLVMSGNIAVSDVDDGTLLFATMKECKKAGWLTLKPFGAGFHQAVITDVGRMKIKDRRSGRTGTN
ncbi:MAG: hypothetical protein ISR53_02930, partial [Rhodospirillales bacterium]|nr:hypothetical protein [Rhodospirillales bacterium]